MHHPHGSGPPRRAKKYHASSSLVAGFLFLFEAALPCPVCAQGTPQPQRAGEVVRVVPAVNIARGNQQLPAAAQVAVQWEDVVKTERMARARVRLDDGSILNVGSESNLRIESHDAPAQRTELELLYGRVRAKVVKSTQPDPSFRIRSPIGVVGVVGTHFWVSLVGDYMDVLCLEGTVTVRSMDAQIPGQAILRAGDFIRVERSTPLPSPTKAPPEKLQEAIDETDVPAGPLEWSRAEVSWPPAGCGEGVRLQVRAWMKETREGKEVETPVGDDLVSGYLTLGGASIAVEGGEAVLSVPPAEQLPTGAFTPRGKTTPLPTKIWQPKKLVAGEGWRSPRAVFTGSAFYVLGPMNGGQPQFFFGKAPAALLWTGSCGAGFLAPMLPGHEYEVALKISGAEVARGRMNLISVGYRMPSPPAAMKGQTSSFGVDLLGLENLAAFTQGRPVVVTTITNNTPVILGNLRSATRGARVLGQTIVYAVGAGNVDAIGGMHLDGSGRGLQAGPFVLGVENRLDSFLEEPRTPLTVTAAPKK